LQVVEDLLVDVAEMLPFGQVVEVNRGDLVDFPRFGFKPSSSRRNRFSANVMSS